MKKHYLLYEAFDRNGENLLDNLISTAFVVLIVELIKVSQKNKIFTAITNIGVINTNPEYIQGVTKKDWLYECSIVLS